MKKGEPKKVKTPGRPTSLKVTMEKEQRENDSKVQGEILTLFMVPYSEHDKYEVKLVKDQPHHEFVLNGQTVLGDLGLSGQETFTVVISFKKRSPKLKRVYAASSRPRRQAAEVAKTIIPVSLKNDDMLIHAERKANKKNKNKNNKQLRNDGSSFPALGIRLTDGKKFGLHISRGRKACKVRGSFGGVGRVLANSNPVFPKEKLVMGCKISHSDVAEILLSALVQKITWSLRDFMHNGNISWKRRERKGRLCLVSWPSVLGIMISHY